MIGEGIVKVDLPKNIEIQPASAAVDDLPAGFGEVLKTISITLPLPKKTGPEEPRSLIGRLFGR